MGLLCGPRLPQRSLNKHGAAQAGPFARETHGNLTLKLTVVRVQRTLRNTCGTDLAEVEVDEVLRLVGHIRAEVAADHGVPGGVVLPQHASPLLALPVIRQSLALTTSKYMHLT